MFLSTIRLMYNPTLHAIRSNIQAPLGSLEGWKNLLKRDKNFVLLLELKEAKAKQSRVESNDSRSQITFLSIA